MVDIIKNKYNKIYPKYKVVVVDKCGNVSFIPKRRVFLVFYTKWFVSNRYNYKTCFVGKNKLEAVKYIDSIINGKTYIKTYIL